MYTIGYLELHVTDSCNLNCKGCSHLSNLRKQEEHVPFEQFRNDLIRMHELIPGVKKLRLLGGEPFLNPELTRYAEEARRIYGDSDIRIVSNGLLCLSADRSLFGKLRENRIGIDISLYPPTVKIKEELEALFKDCGTDHSFTQPITRFAKRIDLKGESDINSTFWDCSSKWCNFLHRGVLCSCPVPVMLELLAERYGLSGIDTDGGKINIHDDDLDPEKVISFLKTPNPLCRYCTEPEFFDWKCNQSCELTDWVV